MKGSNTYTERQKVPNIGEQLFEQYCIEKQVFYRRLGFDEKNDPLPFFYGINPLVRNLPDYYVATKTRGFFVMVKGTANMKKKEIQMIPQFMEWYGSRDVALYYAFCFEDKKVAFRTPDQVIELYQKSSDKQWNDGVIYRSLKIES